MKLVNPRLLIVLLLSYALAMVALLPVSWLVPLFAEPLTRSGVQVKQPQGNIWQGSARVAEENIGEVALQWGLKWPLLLLLQAPFELRLSNNHLELSGVVAASPLGFSLSELNGYVDEQALAKLYQTYRADISGRLQLLDLAADVSWARRLGDASGQVTWSGGPLSIPVGRSQQTFEVPMMRGTLSSNSTEWLFDVRNNQNQQYITASLSADGLGSLSVKRELVADMNITIPGGGSSLLDISQQLF